MSIVYQQTDTAGGCTAGGANFEGLEGGSAGTSESQVTLASEGASSRFNYQLDPSGTDVDWNSGEWTIRVDVTDANMNITWEETDWKRYNSSCVEQETFHNDTAVSISFGSTGVKTETTGSVSGDVPSAGDICIVAPIQTNGAMMTEGWGITPSQNIDSPFTTAVAGGPSYPEALFAKPKTYIRM